MCVRDDNGSLGISEETVIAPPKPRVKPLVLNFSHPLSEEAERQIVEQIGGHYELKEVTVQLQLNLPLEEQIHWIIENVELSSHSWQTRPFFLILPGHSSAAALVLAQVHGRCGFFPRILHLTAGSDRVYLLREVLDLQQVRDFARTKR